MFLLNYFKGRCWEWKIPIFGELAIFPFFILSSVSSNLKLHNYRVRERIWKFRLTKLLKCAVADIERFLSDQDRLPVKLTIDRMQFWWYIMMHIFRQVLFWAGNQGNHQNFEKFLLSYKLWLVFMRMKQIIFSFFWKKNQNGRLKIKLIFQLRQFSIFFRCWKHSWISQFKMLFTAQYKSFK